MYMNNESDYVDVAPAERRRIHIGMRKMKSILAMFVGFCLWQLIRLVFPGLEVHPIFMYIYGIIEIRDSSEKTINMGRLRITATFTAILTGFPFMVLSDWLRPMLPESWMVTSMEIGIILMGALAVLVVAELVKCGLFCGLAAGIFVILLNSHFESAQYLYSVLRAFQTIMAVGIAWIINVWLLPYPPRKGSLSYWIAVRRAKRGSASARAQLEIAARQEDKAHDPNALAHDSPAGVF